MVDRRTFLKNTALATTAASGLLAACETPLATKGNKTAAQAGASAGQGVAAAGGTDLTQVPDTLELADHARMAINGILGSLDPKLNYESIGMAFLDTNPPYMLHGSSVVSGVQPKFVEALPMLRLMSGGKELLDIENGFMEAMIRNAAGDGLIYDRALPSRPWNVGMGYGKADWNEDYANMAGNGRYIAGEIFMYQATGDEAWKRRAKQTAEMMLKLAIVEGDKAWYPNPGCGNDFSYPRKTGWTTRKPPMDAKEGTEGASMFYLCQPIRGFTQYYALTGDERFLDLSRKFANTGLVPKFWKAIGDMEEQASFEKAHFNGHLHGNLAAIRGILDYALVANDPRLKGMIRDSYEWVRQMGISRLGLIAQTKGNVWEAQMEGCAIGDMVGLAVALTDAGLGDYWDDVECIARNALIECQTTDMKELKRVSSQGKVRPQGSKFGGIFDTRFGKNKRGSLPGQEIYDNVLERTIGAFTHLSGARYQMPITMSCCTANGNQGFYFAWEGITRRQDDTAVVNMWLNRRSPWLDVWSWLPHEGKLFVQNKGMHKILVRKPGWARPSQIVCRIDGQVVNPTWVGNRMLFTGLKGREQLSFEVPVAHDKTVYTLVNVNAPMSPEGTFECEFNGHTAIDVKRLTTGTDTEERNWYRLFRREAMRADQAPLKPAPTYVHPEKIVQWLNL